MKDLRSSFRRGSFGVELWGGELSTVAGAVRRVGERLEEVLAVVGDVAGGLSIGPLLRGELGGDVVEVQVPGVLLVPAGVSSNRSR